VHGRGMLGVETSCASDEIIMQVVDILTNVATSKCGSLMHRRNP